jgi:hypothetical protein
MLGVERWAFAFFESEWSAITPQANSGGDENRGEY